MLRPGVGAPAAGRLFEAVAVTVPGENVDEVGETVVQGAGQAL